jgi:transcriptional regulator with XRE-family HTH domain
MPTRLVSHAPPSAYAEQAYPIQATTFNVQQLRRGLKMPFLQEQWNSHTRQLSPPRRYSNQREFEADWIGTLRRRYSLSQEALAALANVSVTTVQNWENPQSHKSIAAHNQDRLRDIERDLWIKSHVTLLAPCPPFLRALYDLLGANKDASAQGLAEYLVATMPENDPERPRLLHWAGLTHSIADPASYQARDYQNAALRALGQSSVPLAAAIENEILGSQFEHLLTQPHGPARQEKGQHLLAACERLFQRDHQAAYKWNALEVACRTPLSAATQYDLLNELNQLLGEKTVQRKIQSDDAYEVLRLNFATSTTVN